MDVLDFMYQEIRTCVLMRKSCIYTPFIQALIESVCPAAAIASFRTSLPKRNQSFSPQISSQLTDAPPRRRKVATLGLGINLPTLLAVLPLLASPLLQICQVPLASPEVL